MTITESPDEPQEERIARLRAELEKLGGSTTTFALMTPALEQVLTRHAPAHARRRGAQKQTQGIDRTHVAAWRVPAAHESPLRSRALRFSEVRREILIV